MTVDNWLSLTSFIVVMSLLTLFVYSTIVLLFKNKKQAKVIVQLLIDNKTVSDQLAEHISTKNVEESEGFLRFVTQSRDWAFEYIETVQAELNKFVGTVGPVMEYYDKYGRINETPSMNTIFDAYTELVKVLPETNEKQGETK